MNYLASALRRIDKSTDFNGPNGCWVWKCRTNSKGYACFFFKGKQAVAVHRLLYQLVHGVLLPRTVFCLHKCDNPLCINPDHIFLGDDAANTRDKVLKDRHARGERNFHARLTETQVLEIRKLRAEGLNGIEIGKRFGIAPSHACEIWNRKLWKHL